MLHPLRFSRLPWGQYFEKAREFSVAIYVAVCDGDGARRGIDHSRRASD